MVNSSKEQRTINIVTSLYSLSGCITTVFVRLDSKIDQQTYLRVHTVSLAVSNSFLMNINNGEQIVNSEHIYKSVQSHWQYQNSFHKNINNSERIYKSIQSHWKYQTVTVKI